GRCTRRTTSANASVSPPRTSRTSSSSVSPVRSGRAGVIGRRLYYARYRRTIPNDRKGRIRVGLRWGLKSRRGGPPKRSAPNPSKSALAVDLLATVAAARHPHETEPDHESPQHHL